VVAASVAYTIPQLTDPVDTWERTSLTLPQKEILDWILSQIPSVVRISSEYWPTGTSLLPRAIRLTLSVARSSKAVISVAADPGVAAAVGAAVGAAVAATDEAALAVAAAVDAAVEAAVEAAGTVDAGEAALPQAVSREARVRARIRAILLFNILFIIQPPILL
jgi:hypothetical protein